MRQHEAIYLQEPRISADGAIAVVADVSGANVVSVCRQACSSSMQLLM